MKNSIKSVSVKNLVAAPTVDAPTTVASVEAYDKAVSKASKVKAPKPTAKQVHHVAPDGVTRINASLDAQLRGAMCDAYALGKALASTKSLNASIRAAMGRVWATPAIVGDMTSPARVFERLQELGYIPKEEGKSGNAKSPYLAYNLATFGTNFHPLFKGLHNSQPKNVEKAKIVAAEKATEKTKKTEKSSETKGITAPAVVTDLHVKATCGKFMEMKPTATQRTALLKAVALALGFTLSGYKSIEAAPL